MWVIRALTAAACAAAVAAQLTASRLRVEYLDSPVGIDVPAPRFSFAAVAPARGTSVSAYRIVVLAPGGAVAWDSSKTKTTANQSTLNIAYAGTPLASDTSYTWTAQWWNQNDTASAAAGAAFSTGLFAKADWHGAVFVGGANQLRAEFTVGAPVARARLFIVGLGCAVWMGRRARHPRASPSPPPARRPPAPPPALPPRKPAPESRPTIFCSAQLLRLVLERPAHGHARAGALHHV